MRGVGQRNVFWLNILKFKRILIILMKENEEELKRLLMKMKEKSKKAGIKLSIQKAKIMASWPITSWQIDGEEGEAVTAFIFLGFRVAADSRRSCRIKTPAPWKES